MSDVEDVNLPETDPCHRVEESLVVVDNEGECKANRSGLLCVGFGLGRDRVEVEVEAVVGRTVEMRVGGFDVG